MFPFCFEWVWDIDHMVFFGAMWYVISILGLGMTYCVLKSIVETIHGDGTQK